nr:CFI-box-CTERM domain-containing protein [Paracoccus saliphilus]
MTNDSAKPDSPFSAQASEVRFSNFRYPGGGVTEEQTWQNGGLARIFGAPMEPGSENYAMTLREALHVAAENGASLSIVIPTFQFYNPALKTFDSAGFNRYLSQTEKAIIENPGVTISAFEIGNEYWAEISASDYGRIANFQIPWLSALSDRIQDHLGDDWKKPDIGIQAGAAWRPSGARESQEIAEQISMENRDQVDIIYQHTYPDPYKAFDLQMEGALKPVKAMQQMPGFRPDLDVSLSEFNIGIHAGDQPLYGVNHATIWIEELSRHVTAGVDQIDHWGGAYKWLTTKMYDAKFPPAESDGGAIAAKATPLGQIYDIASTGLAGMRIIDDRAAVQGLGIKGQFSVTGFQSDTQRVIFMGNMSDKAGAIRLDDIAPGKHVTIRHLVAADSPHSSWYDESTMHLHSTDQIVDARGDMKVISGADLRDTFGVKSNEIAVITISDRGQDLFIEGAHNVTDERTGMVDDQIRGGRGDDLLVGHVGNDTLMGLAGHNVLIAGAGDDLLIGGGSSDIFVSDRGSDTIEGGGGMNLMLIGGDPSDNPVLVDAGLGPSFVLTNGARDVVITDLKAGDHLGFGGAFKDAAELEAATREEEGDLIIDMNGRGSVSIIEGAGLKAQLSKMTFDFLPKQEAAYIADDFLSPLNQDQLVATYDFFRDTADQDHENSYWKPFSSYISDLQAETPIPKDNIVNPGPAPDTGEPNRDDRTNNPDDRDDDSDPASSSCFVATAAFGDRLHPDVVSLRAFRDLHLRRYTAGRWFIWFYWQVGPLMARHVSPHHWTGRTCRSSLTRLVRGLQRLDLCGKKFPAGGAG